MKNKIILLLLNIMTLLFCFSSHAQIYKYKQIRIGGARKVGLKGNIYISDSIIVDNPDIKTSQSMTVNYPVKVVEDNEQTKIFKVIRPQNDNTQQDIVFYFDKQKGILKMELKNNFTNSVFDYEYFFK